MVGDTLRNRGAGNYDAKSGTVRPPRRLPVERKPINLVEKLGRVSEHWPPKISSPLAAWFVGEF
jgi:hypothetical protein